MKAGIVDQDDQVVAPLGESAAKGAEELVVGRDLVEDLGETHHGVLLHRPDHGRAGLTDQGPTERLDHRVGEPGPERPHHGGAVEIATRLPGRDQDFRGHAR
jgi:hypothetical protein